MCAIASIGLDHTEVLGETRPAIARQKGGIIQPGNRVVVQRQDSEVLEVLRQCADRAASFSTVTPCSTLPEELGYQRANASLAAAAYEALRDDLGLPPLQSTDLARAAAATPPGRFERLMINGRTVLLDTAHSVQKLSAMRERSVGALPAPYVLCVAFSEAPEKKINEMVTELAMFAPIQIVATEYDAQSSPTGKRAVPCDRIATLVDALNIVTQSVHDPRQAIRTCLQHTRGTVIVTGSTYLVAQLRPELLAATTARIVRSPDPGVQ